MRLFVSGSAPLPSHVHDAFRERFGHSILERYGMTETFMNVSNPYDGERRAGTVGFPLPGVEVRITTEDGRAAAPGEAGEVQIRGANVLRVTGGARRRVERVRGRLVQDGDIGVQSADGYISLRGRATDLIISGGFNIYPREIEEVILEVPACARPSWLVPADPVPGRCPWPTFRPASRTMRPPS
jgi:malonyl-CoA/methylmalonyl-CoA synthetase